MHTHTRIAHTLNAYTHARNIADEQKRRTEKTKGHGERKRGTVKMNGKHKLKDERRVEKTNDKLAVRLAIVPYGDGHQLAIVAYRDGQLYSMCAEP